MSRRLWSLSDREDLAPGPARAFSATPAAGPGENLGGHSVGARSATAGCLRASAAQGCGPHGSRSRPLHRHSLQKPLFRFLYGIHLSDCSLRLLRATATVRRESWRRSVRSANVGLRPRMLPMPLMPATWLSRRARHVPWTPMELMRTDSPCAASKHLHGVAFFLLYIRYGKLNAKNFLHRHSGPPDPPQERLWIPWKRGLRMRVRISFQEIDLMWQI